MWGLGALKELGKEQQFFRRRIGVTREHVAFGPEDAVVSRRGKTSFRKTGQEVGLVSHRPEDAVQARSSCVHELPTPLNDSPL